MPMLSCLVPALLSVSLALAPPAPAPAPGPEPLAAAQRVVPAEAARTESGLASQVLRPGRGQAKPGPHDYVTAFYTIWSADGRVVDSTPVADGPVLLPMDRVMKGLGEGVQLMTEGELRRLWIPAGMGFPPGKGLPTTLLVVDVELFDINPSPSVAPADLLQPPADAILRPSGLIYRVLRPGTGTQHPSKRDMVTVHYSGWTTDGKLFDSSLVKRSPGAFRVDEVVKGWSEALRLMVKGEKVRVWIPEKLAYKGEAGKPAGTLVFDVELLSIWP